MRHESEFEIFFDNSKWRTIVDLLLREGFEMEIDSFLHICYARKSMGNYEVSLVAEPDNWAIRRSSEWELQWELLIYTSKILHCTGYIEGKKEEIVHFLMYFFDFAMSRKFLIKPTKFCLNSSENKWIKIESEADIYEIFDENSPKIKSYGQI
ncbi:hypothetical protein [Emticicia fontis]